MLGAQGELDDAQRGSRRACGERASAGISAASGHGRKVWAGSPPARDYPQARELFEQSLAILRSLDDAWGTLGSLSGLALVALEEHDYGTARRLLDESLELLRMSGHRYRTANTLEIAARLAGARVSTCRGARLYAAANVVRGSRAVGMFECEAWPDPPPHVARLRSDLGEQAVRRRVGRRRGDDARRGDGLCARPSDRTPIATLPPSVRRRGICSWTAERTPQSVRSRDPFPATRPHDRHDRDGGGVWGSGARRAPTCPSRGSRRITDGY